jgi:hypothetical protein
MALNLEAPMDRHIVIAVLLLVGLTWLLYKLTVLMQPRDKPPAYERKDK